MNTTAEKDKKLGRDERKESIVQGAAEAFVKNGYDATTLDDVAVSAGVSRALLYRHFDTKLAIYRAVLDAFLANFHELVVPSDGRQWAYSTLSGLVQIAQIDPNGFRLFFRHAVREPEFRNYHEDVTAKRLAYIENNLRETIKDSQERRFMAELIQELVIGTILIWIDNGLPNPDMMPGLIAGILNSVIENETK
jgi:AcrR family transcriptional regulator